MEGQKCAIRHRERLSWASSQSALLLAVMAETAEAEAEADMAEDLLDKPSGPLCPRLRLSRAIQT